MTALKTTLCFITKDNKILLGFKKRGFGKGWWNGFGGKVKNNESVVNATKREVLEEVNIRVSKLQKAGLLKFTFSNTSEKIKVFVYRATEYQGTPAETEEMKPRWFSFSRIPYNKMWPDDRFWMPLFLAKKNFVGTFKFNSQNQIIFQNLTTIN